MTGAPYEVDRTGKTKDFPLFGRDSGFTDDSVITIAVADALTGIDREANDETVHNAVIASMRKWGKRYPEAVTAFLEGNDFEDVLLFLMKRNIMSKRIKNADIRFCACQNCNHTREELDEKVVM